MDKSYCKEFNYTHKNPYHDKLAAYEQFVLRDDEGEKFKGLWNHLVFERQAPLHIEIGSGFGHFMLQFCENHPDINFIGMDYRFKRSFQLAKKLDRHPFKNFRYLRAKGERIEYLFDDHEVDALYYFFPDPWPKTRHHKKRLFQRPFLEAAFKILKADGLLYIKTDHDELALWMERVISEQNQFEIIFSSKDLHGHYPDHFLAQYKTKFEKIFLEQNIKIKSFILRKI